MSGSYREFVETIERLRVEREVAVARAEVAEARLAATREALRRIVDGDLRREIYDDQMAMDASREIARAALVSDRDTNKGETP